MTNSLDTAPIKPAASASYSRNSRFGRFAAFDPQPPQPYHWTRIDSYSTAIIAVLALVTRFVALGGVTASGTPIFDEKHYVPQAWDMVTSWINPLLGGIESNPGYGLVVHPPLAKQIEALGEFVFGYTPLGWRIMAASFGVGIVLAIMALTRQVTNSSTAAMFAGMISLFDGVLLVTSRFGMLDIFQAFFIVLATWAFIKDRRQIATRMFHAYASGACFGPYGPRFGFRWWRFSMGIFLGLALSVKWSGLYYMAFFGILSVLLDVRLRSNYRIYHPLAGTLIKDAFPAFASIVIVPVLTYFWSWRAWFAQETSVFRHAATDGTIPPESKLHMLPDALASFFYYHQSVLHFHSSLTSSSGHSHPWDSKPWAWLVAARPIRYYSATNLECGAQTCKRMIYLFGTPAIWWLTVPILLWAMWAIVVKRQHSLLVPVVAFAAGFLPWIAAYDRQMYFFYATALVPFTIVLIAAFLDELFRSTKHPLPDGFHIAGARLNYRNQLFVVAYLALVFAMFIYFSPMLYGIKVPDPYYDSLVWLPSWN